MTFKCCIIIRFSFDRSILENKKSQILHCYWILADKSTVDFATGLYHLYENHHSSLTVSPVTKTINGNCCMRNEHLHGFWHLCWWCELNLASVLSPYPFGKHLGNVGIMKLESLLGMRTTAPKSYILLTVTIGPSFGFMRWSQIRCRFCFCIKSR